MNPYHSRKKYRPTKYIILWLACNRAITHEIEDTVYECLDDAEAHAQWLITQHPRKFQYGQEIWHQNYVILRWDLMKNRLDCTKNTEFITREELIRKGVDMERQRAPYDVIWSNPPLDEQNNHTKNNI